MDNELLILFGKHLSKLRKNLNLSQEELAEKCGLHRTYIGMVERGEKNITLLNIIKISKALNIELKEFVDFIDKK